LPNDRTRQLVLNQNIEESRFKSKGGKLNREERKDMSIISTLISTLIVATAIATLGIQVGPAFAQGYSNDSGFPRPSYYEGDGTRPQNEQPLRNKMTGGGADRITNNAANAAALPSRSGDGVAPLPACIPLVSLKM